MAVLVKIDGSPPGQYIELRDRETVIGRLPECSVVLDEQGVSRKHAAIRREGDRYFLTDLNSRNFTFLNQQQLPADQSQLLKPGDRITICSVELVFYHQVPGETPSGDRDAIQITEGAEEASFHTVDASRSDLTCAVRPEVKLRAILEITRNLCSTLQLDIAAPKILETLLDIFPQAERCFLVLLKEGMDHPTRLQIFHKLRPNRRTGGKGALGRPQGDEARMTISKTIMNTVLHQKKAVLSQDASNDFNAPIIASIADLRIRSFMCAPLLTPDGLSLGILQLDTINRVRFGREDLDLLVAMAGQASIAVHNAAMHETILANEQFERDLRLAEQVKRRFLPQTIPSVASFEFFAYYRACYGVDVDYYDFVPLPSDRLAVALGDVSDKGISAALVMAKFSGDTRYCILTEDAPAAAADRLNELLYVAGFDERFITLCLGVLDLATRRFTFCSAGHLPILVRRANGTIVGCGQDISGFPLGVLPDSNFKQESVDLEPGDIVVIYSDGATDGHNGKGELYDTSETPRLRRRLAAAIGGPDAVGRALIQDIREFSEGQPQMDDLTLICFGPVAP